MIIGVGTNTSFETRWQSPDLPAPTIATTPAKPGGAGWMLMALSTTGRKVTRIVLGDPSPCVQAGGINGGNTSQYFVDRQTDRQTDMTDKSKPPYRVPSMAEIIALPWNGYKVASTFSGCGGSCLGYRMAGFKIVWANEFVPAAQASYKANADPACYLDCRDIRNVQPEELLAQTGLAIGELDLFDGSPPCQAFSTAGKREKGWGKDKRYEHGAKQKNETLFDEYIRLLRGLQPKMFVAENVSGLVKGAAKGYFLDILAGLKACGYRVAVKVLDAQWLGVPQQRQRVIFIGVRNDLGLEPVHPKPLPYRYSVRDALPWIDTCESGPTGFGAGSLLATAPAPAPAVSASMQAPYAGHHVTRRTLRSDVECQSGARPRLFKSANGASPVVVAGRTTVLRHDDHARKFTIAELKRICAFPDDFVLTGSYAQQWERLGNSVPPVMAYHIGMAVRSVLDRIG